MTKRDPTLNGSFCVKHRAPLPCRVCAGAVSEQDVERAATMAILQVMNRPNGFIDPQHVRTLTKGPTT